MELISTMPQTTLDAGCTITAEAIDPATGATVAGVLISNFAIYAYEPAEPDEGTISLVDPLWLPVPLEAA